MAEIELMQNLIDAAERIADQLERVGDTRQHKDGQFIDDVRDAIAAWNRRSPQDGRGRALEEALRKISDRTYGSSWNMATDIFGIAHQALQSPVPGGDGNDVAAAPQADPGNRSGATGWQTIDSAPKDGTEILAYWSASKVHSIVLWAVKDGWWMEEFDRGMVSAPTHWQPLTTPTQTAASDAGPPTRAASHLPSPDPVREEMARALEKISRTPSMPFPDPGAHSWRAWGVSVYSAWQEIQSTARTALRLHRGE